MGYNDLQVSSGAAAGKEMTPSAPVHDILPAVNYPPTPPPNEINTAAAAVQSPGSNEGVERGRHARSLISYLPKIRSENSTNDHADAIKINSNRKPQTDRKVERGRVRKEKSKPRPRARCKSTDKTDKEPVSTPTVGCRCSNYPHCATNTETKRGRAVKARAVLPGVSVKRKRGTKSDEDDRNSFNLQALLNKKIAQKLYNGRTKKQKTKFTSTYAGRVLSKRARENDLNAGEPPKKIQALLNFIGSKACKRTSSEDIFNADSKKQKKKFSPSHASRQLSKRARETSDDDNDDDGEPSPKTLALQNSFETKSRKRTSNDAKLDDLYSLNPARDARWAASAAKRIKQTSAGNENSRKRSFGQARLDDVPSGLNARRDRIYDPSSPKISRKTGYNQINTREDSVNAAGVHPNSTEKPITFAATLRKRAASAMDVEPHGINRRRDELMNPIVAKIPRVTGSNRFLTPNSGDFPMGVM